MRDKILFVDDDLEVLVYYKEYFDLTFSVDTAQSAPQALEMMKTCSEYAVIVADMNMPEMDGIELLVKAQQTVPDTVRIMLTGEVETRTAIEAINKGHIYQFLTKPCAFELLSATLRQAVRHYRLAKAERVVLEHTLSGSVDVLTEILSTVEPRSFGEGQKIRDYVQKLTDFLKFSDSWEVEIAALLGGIGHVTVPKAIVEKWHAGVSLNAVEKGLLTRAPEFGRNLLVRIPRLERVADYIYYQAKNFDGTGFPHDSVSGDKIPVGGRVLKILGDMVRQETKGIHRIQALREMKQKRGLYDPTILESALSCLLFEKNGRAVGLQDLCVGEVLLSEIMTHEGVLIVPAGNRVSPTLLQKLSNFTELSAIKEPIFVEG